MAEALSQNQIDELLNRMKSGETTVEKETNKVKEYNFASPKKLTKDQLKSLSNFIENFSRIISSYYTNVLHSICEVSINTIEEQRYFEFNNAVPDNTLVGVIGFQPEKASYDETTMLYELSTSFGYLLVERLMGGSGECYAPDRDYTEIELALLESVMENVAKYMKESWSNYFPLNTSYQGIQTNGRLLQAFSPQDIVVIVTFDIKEEDYTGTANLCIPADKLEEVISNMNAKYSHSTKQPDEEKEHIKQEMVLDYIKQSDLKIEACLDYCNMSLSDLSQLQPNNVIVLNKRIDDDISVNVEGVPWYTARVGEINGKKAIKLVESIDVFVNQREGKVIE